LKHSTEGEARVSAASKHVKHQRLVDELRKLCSGFVQLDAEAKTHGGVMIKVDPGTSQATLNRFLSELDQEEKKRLRRDPSTVRRRKPSGLASKNITLDSRPISRLFTILGEAPLSVPPFSSRSRAWVRHAPSQRPHRYLNVENSGDRLVGCSVVYPLGPAPPPS